MTFVGDWHTHPNGPALPSRRDRKAAGQLANDPDYGTPTPVIAIVALGGWPIRRRSPSVAFFIRSDDGKMNAARIDRFDELPPIAADVPWSWTGR